MRKGAMRLIAGATLAASSCATADVQPLMELNVEAQPARQADDVAAVTRYRVGLMRAIDFVRSDNVLFPAAPLSAPRLPSSDQRETIRRTWARMLDYYIALDSIGSYHRDFYKLRDRKRRHGSFFVAYAAFLAQYRCALEFIERANNDPGIDRILNDALPELGLPAGTYAKFKYRFLNVGRAVEFAAMAAYYPSCAADAPENLRLGIAADTEIIWRMGRGRGEAMTALNALAVIQKAGFTAWFPVQSGVAEWMGDTKVWRRDRSLIVAEQIRALPARLQPGDVLLVRREWFLSNIGLPGFWPHAAIYVGTPAERRAFFNTPEAQAWVRAQGQADGDFEALLRARFADAYKAAIAPLEHDHAPRVIEAMSEGVSFTSLEHAVDADAAAALRPRLTRPEKARALLRAFAYHGRPYDFDFNFLTDSALVCSEVVYKAYEPQADARGLKLPLTQVMGRTVTPPNDMARQFDEQYGTADQQYDLVVFLDGHEREGKAVEETLAEFRRSWQRPKWHILVQDSLEP